jgi:hypothetical protein
MPRSGYYLRKSLPRERRDFFGRRITLVRPSARSKGDIRHGFSAHIRSGKLPLYQGGISVFRRCRSPSRVCHRTRTIFAAAAAGGSLRGGRSAFAACELRSSTPFTEQGFYEFNKAYVITLERWGIYRDGDERLNPVARTNVCPLYGAPAEPEMAAFSYTVPAPDAPARGTFILAGGGEARGGPGSFRSRIVRVGDTTPEGMREKVLFVAAEMERRLGLLGFSWADAISTQAYTVHNIGHLVGDVLAARGACTSGLTWHYARPPVIDLEFEMDVRGAAREIIV